MSGRAQEVCHTSQSQAPRGHTQPSPTHSLCLSWGQFEHEIRTRHVCFQYFLLLPVCNDTGCSTHFMNDTRPAGFRATLAKGPIIPFLAFHSPPPTSLLPTQLHFHCSAQGTHLTLILLFSPGKTRPGNANAPSTLAWTSVAERDQKRI